MPAASPSQQHAPFNQLLPSEVSAGSTWFGRARSYPIFSPSWYRYRSRALLTGYLVVFLILGAMIGVPLIGAPAIPIDWTNVARVTAVLLLPLLALCLVGPGLAVLARRRALARFETAVLLVALLLGIGLSGALFALLAVLYEQPRHDAANGVIVARFLPRIRIDVRVEDGAKRTYRDGPAALAAAAEMNAAAHRLFEANVAAGVPARADHQQPMRDAHRQALDHMRMLDTGHIVVSPERRKEIEQAYLRTLKEQGREGERLAQLHGSGERRALTVQQEAALKQVAAASARMVNPEMPAPGRQQVLVSKEIGKAALVVIAIGCALLLSWLGGLVDLLAFVRQRGRLANVLEQKELERTRAARNHAEMRLSVLTAQVEPHFLFNTLASVRSAIDSDPQRAGHIVDHMVAFLRASIPQMRDDAANAAVTLARELHAARCYLALMHERMPRLQFSIDAEPTLDAAQVPPLMLISLVENAVKHGVEPKIGAAHIAVRARRIDTEGEPLLEISVSDDGVGFGEAASGHGIGLANIQERLRSYFGQRASLTLKVLPEGGIAAILRVPLSFDY